MFVRLVEMLILFGGESRQVNSEELFKADHVLPNDIMSQKPQKTSLPLNLYNGALAEKSNGVLYVTFNHIINYPDQVPPLVSFFVEYIYIDVSKIRGM